MAFCTNCGANVVGAFCSQCGAPANAAGQPAPAAPAAAQFTPMAQAAAPAAAPVAMPMPSPGPRRTSPLVWVLVALAGVFLLFVVGAIGVSALLFHKAHQAGLDTDLIRRNPAAAVARMAAMANRNVEIVGEDDRNGTITLRDRNTGKVVTMSFDQAKNGIRFTADDDNGKTAELQIGGGAAKLPLWVPKYPGADEQATFAVKGSDENGAGQGGNYTFTTQDSPSQVMSFYQQKVKDLQMETKVTASTDDGGTIVATEEPGPRTLTVVVGRDAAKTTVNVTYADKR